MKRYIFTLTLSLIGIIAFLAMSGILYADSRPAFTKIDSKLFNELTDAKEDKSFPILVRFNDFQGKDELYERIRSFPMPKRREKGMKLIKEHIKEYQKDILFELNKNKDAKQIQSFWLSNSIFLEAPKELIFDLAAKEEVRNIIWNRTMKFIPDCFNDTEQDALNIQNMDSTPWGVRKIKADKVWALGFKGQGVVIAGIDTGVRYTHESLASHMWNNPGEIPGNGIDDDDNGFVDDYYGYDIVNDDPDPMDDFTDMWHGTHTAGIFAGDGSGGKHIGVAPEAQVMAVKVVANGGNSSPLIIKQGLEYAIDNGADVVNLCAGYSYDDYGSHADYLTVKNAFRKVVETALTVGVVFAIAAGNGRRPSGHYPAPYDICAPADAPPPWYGSGGHTAAIAVGNTDSNDAIYSSSSRGPAEWDNSEYNDYPYNPGSGLIKPDVSAPGQDILSAWGAGNTQYRKKGGTSMAAPHVAGVMALMLSKNPDITPEQIDSILEITALELGAAGKDNSYGAGRVQCSIAVAHVPPPSEFPIIIATACSIYDTIADANNNGILDPGETADVTIKLENKGANARGLATTIITPAAYLSLIDDSAYYGDIRLLETKENSSDVFRIQADPNTIPGITTVLELHCSDDSGYAAVESVEFGVSNYPRALDDHVNGYLQTSITNFGGIGFFNPTATPLDGYGFSLNSVNYLCTAGFFLGIDYHNVIGGSYGDSSEWQPSATIEEDRSGGFGKQIRIASFLAPNLSILVKQTSYSFSEPTCNDYLIMEYKIQNWSDTDFSDIYCGTYCDWDLHYDGGWHDNAAFNNTDGIAYMYDPADPPVRSKYVGTVRLDNSDRGSIINNSIYVYPDSMGWDDTVQYKFLSGDFYSEEGLTDEDWATIICKGPFDLPAGDTVTFTCALVSGDDYSSLLDNAANARLMYDSLYNAIENLQHSSGATQPTLLSNTPNPFVKQTAIEYILPERTDIVMKITALNGNTVLSKKIANQARGHHIFRWDGHDQNGMQLNTGIYLFSLETRSSRNQIKMLLMR